MMLFKRRILARSTLNPLDGGEIGTLYNRLGYNGIGYNGNRYNSKKMETQTKRNQVQFSRGNSGLDFRPQIFQIAMLMKHSAATYVVPK